MTSASPILIAWRRTCAGQTWPLKLMDQHQTGGVMNEDTIKGNWKIFKGKIKEKWGKLTDDELDQFEGKKDQIVGRIQEKYGLTRDEAERQYADFESHNKW
jgi:uncharacterized protein YjbJ (UPF0337 family)